MTEKYQFQCDYIAGCHPAVLQALTRTNEEELPGYCEDRHCRLAADRIRTLCNAPQADVHFFVGGTLTNLTVIGSALRPHQGVVAATTGHIFAHETGAIEATGHKVLTLASHDGKIDAGELEALCAGYASNTEKAHLVQPGMLYISFPTETGTIYTLAELQAIAAVCRRRGLFFYLDGARLAYGLAAGGDATLADIATLTDAFCLGGSKCGLLAGEALVITNPVLQRDFAAIKRQRGALLSKGRLVSVQFEALLAGDLYLTIGKEAVARARILRQHLIDAGCEPVGSSTTNQQFFALNDRQVESLSRGFVFEDCGKLPDGRTVVRLCTAWSTRRQAFDALIAAIDQLKGL